MPSKNRIRKSSSATITTSECSKELCDLPDNEYRQLLASVAELPKKILSAESGGGSLGGGDDGATCGREEKLTPAAQSCLNKLVNEIKSGASIIDQKIGTSATFDDSFITRRMESLSAFSSTKKKPVRYDKEAMKYIDEDNDVEMMDLSANNITTRTFTRGNQEQTATEFVDNDVEKGALDSANATSRGFFNSWNENSLRRNGRLLNRSQTILGPQSDGAFFPISKFIDGTDVIPILNPAYDMPPFSKPLLPTPLTQESLSNSSANNAQSQPKDSIIAFTFRDSLLVFSSVLLDDSVSHRPRTWFQRGIIGRILFNVIERNL
ncbi:hypothetical protein KIN20_002938 [Parelaphostrongylus tenuis]|uniref:Uncharacterized protein n=1 Tax=Parelaphostrongylus tenuis TaxID=148309 RepID=A0AAD5MEX1_PARTN|nr:hypothetical protein KIN20_002938 [Parelaphostrongylus tenuis]